MKNKVFLITMATLILTSFISVTTVAATNFIFNLEPGQEVPPVASAGSGSCQVVLAGTFVSVNCSFQNLSQPAIASHIHNAGAGINGPVILALTPSNATSGTISGTGDITVAQATDMQLGQMYINLHSTAFPGGELRGQIVGGVDPSAIPTMSQWGMIALTFLMVVAGFTAFRVRGLKARRKG